MTSRVCSGPNLLALLPASVKPFALRLALCVPKFGPDNGPCDVKPRARDPKLKHSPNHPQLLLAVLVMILFLLYFAPEVKAKAKACICSKTLRFAVLFETRLEADAEVLNVRVVKAVKAASRAGPLAWTPSPKRSFSCFLPVASPRCLFWPAGSEPFNSSFPRLVCG